MDCRRVQLHILDFSTGRLEARLAPSVEAHLESCADCRRVLKREQRTAALLEGLPHIETQVDAWPAIETAIHARAASRRRPIWMHPLAWASAATMAAALAISLAVPNHNPLAAPASPDPVVSTLAPRTAAGLVPDKSRDPLMTLEIRLDRALDRLEDDGS